MDLDRIFTWEMPAKLVFGPGCAGQAGEQLKMLGGSKVLLVTDKGVLQAGVLESVIDGLKTAGVKYAIYDRVEPNPTIQCVELGYTTYRAEACNCLLAVGGGSSIDTAKAIGVLANNPGSNLPDLEGRDRFKKPIPPLVAVPTTCGTGSEATFFSVITDPERHYKFSIASAMLVPKVSLIDARLITKLPAPIVASTGMDALCHAIESYANLIAQPISDALDLQAIQMISRWLRPAVANANLEAMANMLLASTMAGMGFSNTRVTIVHAMSHSVSGYYGVPHGVANAVLLPYVMEYNLIGCPERYSDIAQAMGEPTYGLTTMEAARLSVKAVRELSADIGIQEHLKFYGVDDRHLSSMVEDTMKTTLIPLNPRRVSGKQIEEILRQAIG